MSFNYCTLDDVKAQLLGLDVSDLPATLIDRINNEYIPWSKRDVDMALGQNLDLTQNYREFYDGSGSAELILRRHPINRIRACTLYIIPSAQWYVFKRPFHQNVKEITGTDVAFEGGFSPIGPSDLPPYIVGTPYFDVGVPTGTFADTEDQYANSDLIVDCSKGILTIPPRILFLDNQAIPFWNYTWLSGYRNVSVTYDYGYASQDVLPKEFVNASALLAATYVLKDKALWTSSGAQSININGVTKSFGNMSYDGIIKYMEDTASKLLTKRKRLYV